MGINHLIKQIEICDIRAVEVAMEEKCRRCGAVLFNKVPLDDKGNFAMEEQTPLSLESEAGVSFFRCPACKAKNIVAADISGDLGKQRITHAKD